MAAPHTTGPRPTQHDWLMAEHGIDWTTDPAKLERTDAGLWLTSQTPYTEWPELLGITVTNTNTNTTRAPCK